MNDAERWYYREDGTVRGPVTRSELDTSVSPSTPVCRAGSDDWQPAGRILPDLPPPGETEDPPRTDPDQSRPPTLERFRRLCRRAPEETLEREWRDHRDAYDHRERDVLREERKRRRRGRTAASPWNPIGWVRDLLHFG